jgi:spermidine/putrescine transport system substrate-binding protein
LPPASWRLLFDPAFIPGSVAMVNDAREAVLIAAQYLFGKTRDLTSQELMEIQQLLVKQKPFVQAYTQLRPDYFLSSKNCPLVVSSSSYVWRGMREYKNIAFLLPKEGSFITIEHVAIPKSSKKTELVYKFLNFVYRPASMAHHFNTFVFFPATTNVKDVQGKDITTLDATQMQNLHFFRHAIPHSVLNKLWIYVKTF